MRTPTLLLLLALSACSLFGPAPRGTEPPPDGWANNAPTVVEQVFDRGETQLLAVRQGELVAWVEVPAVGAKTGEYVLLGRGTARTGVEIPELGERVPQVVDITHVQVVDRETAERTLRAGVPDEAVPIGTVYAELDTRADTEIVVHGTVVKSTGAVGAFWVHLQDGTGSAAAGTNDLTIKASAPATQGQRATYRGVLRKDVDLGFGYHYDALVEGERVP